MQKLSILHTIQAKLLLNWSFIIWTKVEWKCLCKMLLEIYTWFHDN